MPEEEAKASVFGEPVRVKVTREAETAPSSQAEEKPKARPNFPIVIKRNPVSIAAQRSSETQVNTERRAENESAEQVNETATAAGSVAQDEESKHEAMMGQIVEIVGANKVVNSSVEDT